MNAALLGNTKTSIHHEFDVGHLLETNAACYLPFSARIPCHHIHQVNSSNYGKSRYLGEKIAWATKYEIQSEK